jgi:hypothetical protein
VVPVPLCGPWGLSYGLDGHHIFHTCSSFGLILAPAYIGPRVQWLKPTTGPLHLNSVGLCPKRPLPTKFPPQSSSLVLKDPPCPKMGFGSGTDPQVMAACLPNRSYPPLMKLSLIRRGHRHFWGDFGFNPPPPQFLHIHRENSRPSLAIESDTIDGNNR